MDKIRLSVVMPSYNEEKAIASMLDSIKNNTKQYDVEILLIDGSSDKTPDIARSMGATVVSQKPQGHGRALREGILRASGDIIITSDCDNTYPMERIGEFARLLTEEGYDIISGNRLSGDVGASMPPSNKLANWFFASLTRLLYGIKTHDVSTGMFGMKRKVAHAIEWETNYAFPSELIIRSVKKGFRYREIPIAYDLRVGKTTLNKWRSGKAYLLCILKYKLLSNIPPGML